MIAITYDKEIFPLCTIFFFYFSPGIERSCIILSQCLFVVADKGIPSAFVKTIHPLCSLIHHPLFFSGHRSILSLCLLWQTKVFQVHLASWQSQMHHAASLLRIPKPMCVVANKGSPSALGLVAQRAGWRFSQN